MHNWGHNPTYRGVFHLIYNWQGPTLYGAPIPSWLPIFNLFAPMNLGAERWGNSLANGGVHTWFIPDSTCQTLNVLYPTYPISSMYGMFITYLCWILMRNGTVNIRSSHGCYAWVWISGTSPSKFRLGKLASCYRVFFWRYAWFVWFFHLPVSTPEKRIRTGSLDNKKITIRCWALKYFVFNLTWGNEEMNVILIFFKMGLVQPPTSWGLCLI